ncbi:hypothetical protein J8281_04590 [Aquimarina sp. U1-2]|uniref:hypothetical protein n=1 Tax=Aquimarina sp. U1-2 TaxID=2823141 RepID=UPI001AECB41F|nr:hypothetical protein [Aquimarina sp. U1-2]MBP2831459.1 hypothetical protein [Aquimarina sp. U1-2]
MSTKQMNRRDFTKLTVAATLGSSVLGVPFACNTTSEEPKKPSLINNLYYRANTFHYNPAHIAADMQWMADHGTNALTMAISEVDFGKAERNIETIVTEAHKRGIKVFFVTSRWAGVFAGAPKMPSIFAAKNPHTWSLKSDGNPYFHSSGPICSIYYPEVFDFFIEHLDKAFKTWDLDGVVWDEPKAYQMDYSAMAKARLQHIPGYETGEKEALITHEGNYCNFISNVNDHIKKEHGDKIINFFAYPYLTDTWIEQASQIKHLDYFGADGRAYPNIERPETYTGKKFILGKGNVGHRYVTKAHDKGLKSMVLIENFKTTPNEYPLLEKHLDTIITMADQFAYYYYPRSCKEPDKAMQLISKHLKKHL